MPDTDGLWALKQLKSDPDTRHIPVVIFTAGLSEQDMRKCKSLGAQDVLVKPFTIAQLRECVDEIRRKSGAACAKGEG
jgi:CheY-like chemotaxis protein